MTAVTKRDAAEYFGELAATHATPRAPCACGERVFYQLADSTGWLCRSCRPPGRGGWRTVVCVHTPPCAGGEHVRSAILRWFVAPRCRP